MKRKMFVAAVWMTLGSVLPMITASAFTSAKNWWQAPPTAPGSEASKLIKSLESSEGWTVAEKDKDVWLSKGAVSVKPCRWSADIQVNGADSNPNFSSTDRSAINDAARNCLRQLTVQAMRAPKEASVNGAADNDTYLVKLPNGKEIQISTKKAAE